MKRKDAKIVKYDAGGYLISIEDNLAELETDTLAEAMRFAHDENCTRVYSMGKFVLINKELK